MTKNISRLLLLLGTLTLATASCDVIDPMDPGSGHSSGRRTGNDTIIVTPDDKVMHETGTIQKMTHFDGYTFWAFVTDGGKHYEPTNLRAEFMQDGVRVRIRALVIEDWSTPYRFGELIEILEIEQLGSAGEGRAAIEPSVYDRM